MKVFVTGGSGFVGGHAIEGLVRAGHEVVALARASAADDKVRGYGAAPVRGDLATVESAHLVGCDAVVHAAAFVAEWGTRAQFWEANVEGTTRLLDAARAAGAKRFIHVGTEAAVFDGHDLIDIDETVPFPAEQRYLYSETKAEAERRVVAASSGALSTIVIRPRLVWGPRDGSVLPAVIAMAKAGRFAWLDGGSQRTSTTHVDNLVHALVLALDHGEPGAAYFVSDDGAQTIRAFLSRAASTQGVDLGVKSVSSKVARPVAKLIEGVWRLFGIARPPPMTRFAIDMMSSSVTVNTERARRELGWAPVTSVDDGMARLADAASGAPAQASPAS